MLALVTKPEFDLAKRNEGLEGDQGVSRISRVGESKMRRSSVAPTTPSKIPRPLTPVVGRPLTELMQSARATKEWSDLHDEPTIKNKKKELGSPS